MSSLRNIKLSIPATIVRCVLGAMAILVSCPALSVLAQGNVEVVITNSAPVPAGETLEFQDGSILHGAFKGMSPKTGIKWEHPDGIQPFEFKADQLHQIRFYQNASTAGASLPCQFQFQNGDSLYGELLSLDDTSARVNTRFGKDLRVDRSALESILFLSKNFNLLFEGPTGLQGWSTGRGGQPWKYREGSFLTEHVGSIGRDFQLPPAGNIEVDVTWEGQLGLIIQAYTENIDRFDYSSASYMLYINANSIMLQRVSPETGISNLGNIQLPAAARKNAFRLELRSSREESALAVYIDGALIQKWKDNSGFAAKGTGVLFFSQHEGPRLKLSNIRVSEWDGKFEDSVRTNSIGNDDMLLLVNQDKVNGQIKSLKNSKLTITAADTPLDIPLQRVSQIHFASRTNRTPAHSDPWYVRASLTGGEKLSFALQDWSNDQVVGTNASFGRMQFAANNVRAIQFNATGIGATTTTQSNAPFALLDEKSDRLSLKNGDTIAGVIKTMDLDKTLRLQRSDSSQALEFRSGSVADITLRKPTGSHTNDCEVTFANGNQLTGNIRELTADTMKLDTWYGGSLSLAKDTIQMIVPLQESRAPLYAGPDDVKNWIMGEVTAVDDAGDWKFQDGSFYANKAASIARDLKLPDVASIQFDIAWNGVLQMAVALYTSRMQPINLATKDAEPDFGGFYSLQLGSMSAGLLMVKKDAPINYLWQMATPLLSQKNQARVEVLVDKSKRSIALLVDGVMLKQAIDNEGFAGSGTAVRFVHQGLGTLRMSNLKVSEWDGLFDEPYSNKGGTNELIRLRNGDRVQGEVQQLDNGKLTIKTETGNLTVPWERVKQLEQPGRHLQVETTDSLNAWGQLSGSAPFKFQFVLWDEKGIHVESPHFGKAVFDPTVFSKLRFNVRK